MSIKSVLHRAEQAAAKKLSNARAEVKKAVNDARFAVDVGVHAVQGLEDRFFHSIDVWTNPAVKTPPDRGGLKFATFNVMLGGRNIDAVEKELRSMSPDVVCLQEVSPENARRLAKNLGMNVAITSVNQKAILTRYPIVETDELRYRTSTKDALAAAKKSRWSEPFIQRSVMRATIQVGGRKIDVLDTHLGLMDSKSNAKELAQLSGYVEARKKTGRTVLLAGDFNDNMALAAQGASDVGAAVATATDTLPEFKDRYHAAPGNMGDPNVRAAAQRLLSSMQHHWQAEERTVKTPSGRALTPEDALAELQSGKVKKGSARFKTLMQVVDGVSHLAANKRFDNIFASNDVRIASTSIDLQTRASDHQPVLSEIRWD